ncbi:MAG: hypothetical protein HY900_08370 [Deltaproteobacteria bacterium]|nr:hypothetical protein [Deltaproteobacteria bacterium]
MKCPKCHYTSFDYLDACKRCGTDLRDVRALLQLIAVAPEDRAFPAQAETPPEPARAFDEPAVAAFAASTPITVPESLDDFGEEPDFGSDTEPSLGDLSEENFDDPFDSLVEPTSYREAAAAADEEESEESLLEPTSHHDAAAAMGEEEEASLVEPTSYRDAAPAEPEEETSGEDGADELLELDFGDLFADVKEEEATP